ncbi:MAG: hypothetical protein OEY59_11015 [Deltaproteobacteria bacterium]|nr:hypothetical protein [Deltaproteobacteria bacterium]
MSKVFLRFYSVILCFPVVVSLWIADLNAFEYKDQLINNQSLHYQHYNILEKKITGFSVITTESVLLEGKRLILELSQNKKPDGKVFSERKIYFEPESGRLVRYQETDFRSELHVTDLFEETKIKTEVKKGELAKSFSIEIEKGLVPFETITLAFQKEIKRLLKEKELPFLLYLPALAFELEKVGLPPSLSKLQMTAQIEKLDQFDTPLGQKKAVWIIARPVSVLIRSLLPKEKTEFRFVFMTEKPNYLLMFEENNTQSVLKEIKLEKGEPELKPLTGAL